MRARRQSGPEVGIVRSTLHVGWQKRGPLSGVRRAVMTFVNVGTWRASVNENVLTSRTLRAENLACACGVVSAIRGRRREWRAHLARRPNEKPAVAQRCGVIIENNLPAGTRAECEESENKRGKDMKRGKGKEERNGHTWSEGGPFIPRSEVSAAFQKVQIGFQGGELAYLCHVLEPSSVESAADQEHSKSLGEVLYSQSLGLQSAEGTRWRPTIS